MDIEKLIEQLSARGLSNGSSLGYHSGLFDEAATALSTLQAENEKLRVEAEGMRSNWYKSVEEIKKLRAEVESLKKGHCAGCSIPAVKTEQIRDLTDAPKLRAELESVRAERNAAVEDVAAIIGDVEEIRRGYGVDNADADGAFARLCETYCANNGCLCYAECEKYHCKNFKWRGI